MTVEPEKPARLRPTLLGVKREDVDALQAYLAHVEERLVQAEQSAARERQRAEGLAAHLAESETELGASRESLAAVSERAQALEARMEAATQDAKVLAAGLPNAMAQLAGLVGDGEGDDLQVLQNALRALLPSRFESVQIMAANEIEPQALAQLQVRGSQTLTWSALPENGQAQSPLAGSMAIAGDRVVVVRYREGVYDDGGFAAVVERLARAVACSLMARAFARERAAKRRPVSLLGDEASAERLRALKQAEGQRVAEVEAVVPSSIERSLTGVWGAPAWSATYFELALRLDALARSAGGEAFELDDRRFLCLVAEAKADRTQKSVQSIVAELGLEGEVALL